MKVRIYMLLLSVAISSVLISSCKPERSRPNIVFAIMDDATYSHFGAYGCDWVSTPNFDRIARDGILFANAYTPNAKCGPSRSALLTGRNSWQLEEAANHWCRFPSKFKTYAEVLVENGYLVGFTGKGWAPGDPGEINGKPRQLTGSAYNNQKLISPTSGISFDNYAANFIDFIDANNEGKPFMFWYGGREPHREYEYGSGITKGGKKLSDIKEIYSFWPQNDTVFTDLLDYAYEIEHFDDQLGLMLQELEERKLLSNTLIIVTSDNGMPFPRIKGQEYELSNHMPLAVMWPDGIKNPGRKVEDFVSFIDLAPTFLELAEVDPLAGGMQPIEGKSLSNLFYSEESGLVDQSRDHVLFGKERHDVGRPNDEGYPIRGIVKGDYLFIQNFEIARWPAGNPETGYLNCDGGPTKTVCLDARNNPDTLKYWEWSFEKRPEFELFNIQKDPICMVNLAGDEKYQSILTELKDQLYDELKNQADPRIMGNGQVFDQYPYVDPTGVNFYERYMNGEEM
ncbi:MAG: sulfatase, partial [Cyclobacteriaceae bacterium]